MVVVISVYLLPIIDGADSAAEFSFDLLLLLLFSQPSQAVAGDSLLLTDFDGPVEKDRVPCLVLYARLRILLILGLGLARALLAASVLVAARQRIAGDRLRSPLSLLGCSSLFGVAGCNVVSRQPVAFSVLAIQSVGNSDQQESHHRIEAFVFSDLVRAACATEQVVDFDIDVDVLVHGDHDNGNYSVAGFVPVV